MHAVVIDDNLMFSMMVVPALKAAGYVVRTLPGAADTTDTLADDPPALACVNLASARYNGPELVRDLRGRDELRHTAILGYAGHVERHLFEQGAAAGADLVVPNSAMRGAFPRVLEKLARRRAGETETEWEEE
jgi:DNA-binding NarL/FixJ family response regulator